MDTSIQRACEGILAAPAVQGRRLVGIDGPSGAGKSTVARAISAALGAPVIEVDDFLSWNNFAGWWPRWEEQVLEPLLRGSPARFQRRDWKGDEFGDALGDWAVVEPQPVVLLEGVTCTRRAASGKLAYSIWVDAPRELRLRRGLERDGESHRALWLRWMAEEAAFFTEDKTRERADLRVTGMDLRSSLAPRSCDKSVPR